MSARLFRLSASDFLCFAKESHQRKATPGASFLRFATECPAVLAVPGRLRNSPESIIPIRAQTVLADSPRSQLRSSAPLMGPQHRQFNTECLHAQLPSHNFGVMAFGVPVGDAEKRSVLRGGRRGLSEQGAASSLLASSAGARFYVNEDASIAGQPRSECGGAVTSGVAFLWLLSLAKQRKLLAERRNEVNWHAIERGSPK